MHRNEVDSIPFFCCMKATMTLLDTPFLRARLMRMLVRKLSSNPDVTVIEGIRDRAGMITATDRRYNISAYYMQFQDNYVRVKYHCRVNPQEVYTRYWHVSTVQHFRRVVLAVGARQG